MRKSKMDRFGVWTIAITFANRPRRWRRRWWRQRQQRSSRTSERQFLPIDVVAERRVCNDRAGRAKR